MKFKEAVDIVLSFEGGYSNHEADPGGETNWGISKRAYPHLDIKNLTKKKAIEIYKEDYWDKVRGDDLPGYMALVVFDCAVNQGSGTAKRLLQKVLGVTQDGVLGPITLRAAVEAMPSKLLNHYLAERAVRYSMNRNVQTFGRGWFRRLFSVALKTINR